MSNGYGSPEIFGLIVELATTLPSLEDEINFRPRCRLPLFATVAQFCDASRTIGGNSW